MGLSEILNIRLMEKYSGNWLHQHIFTNWKEIDEVLGREGSLPSMHIILPERTWPPNGGHWHDNKTEIVFVSGGVVDVYVRNLDTGEEYSREVYPGCKFNIPPRILHKFHNPYDTNVHLIEFSNCKYNPKDVYQLEQESAKTEI